MSDLFIADSLDEEQLDYIESEFIAGFKRYNNYKRPTLVNTKYTRL